jgi:hypothetical protein
MARPRTDDPGGTPSPVNKYDPYIASLSPFLWWKMNDAPGQTVIKDFSPNGYDGTLYGGAGTVAALGVPGPIPGDSALFIATAGSGYPYIVVAPGLTSSLPTITAPFTIIEWFNTSYTAYAMYGSALYSSRQPTEHGTDFCLGPTTSLGQLQSIFGDGTNWLTGEQQFNPTGSPVNTGQWWMASTVVTTAAQTVYLQGDAYSATIPAALTGALLCDTHHVPVVGNETGGPAATQYNGFIAQLALFNYALTAAELAMAYSLA